MKEGHQEYSILAIFTNGNVQSVGETIQSLAGVKDEPLSIVVVAVGPGDFADMSFLNEEQKAGSRVHFVDSKAYEANALTEETLCRMLIYLIWPFEPLTIL